MPLFFCLAYLLSVASNAADNTNIRIKLDSSQEERTWLIAFEELAELKGKLGQWYPIDLLRVSEGIELYCCFKQITRVKGKCKLPYELRTSTGLVRAEGAATWSDGGQDAVLAAKMIVEDGVIYVGVKQNDGTIRRLMIKRAKNIDVFKKTVKVSRAMPLFRWSTAGITEFNK